MGGILDGILGGGSKSDSQEAQLKAMENSARQLQQYRQEAMQGRMNVMNQAAGAYQGANNALQTMYGGRKDPNPAMVGESVGGKFGRQPGAPQPEVSPMANPVAGNPQAPPQAQGGGVGFGDVIGTVLDPLGFFR
jgi:hypothetical protein